MPRLRPAARVSSARVSVSTTEETVTANRRALKDIPQECRMTSSATMTMSERADELEEQMLDELNNKMATKAVLYNMGDGKVEIQNGAAALAANPGKVFLMGHDKR